MLLGGVDEQLAAAARDAGMRVVNHLVHPDGPGLARLVRLVERGALRVVVDHVVALEQAAQAHELSETGRARGKIVLAVS